MQHTARVSALRSALPRVLSIQSHVVYGAAGNSAAVFPMRRLGVEVWPLHTCQFSNHTQYGAWEGYATPSDQISALVAGIESRGVLGRCDAVLSGYLGSAEQGSHVLEAYRKVKSANPEALFACDPVMGHPEKGCIVPAGVSQFFVREAALAADVLSPNVLELGILAGGSDDGSGTPTTPAQVVEACRSLMGANRRTRLVLVKHLAAAGRNPGVAFEMACVTKNEAWHIATPLLPFDRAPVGTGDVTSGLFLCCLLKGAPVKQALEHTASAYHAIMQATHDAGEYELQTVIAQNEIALPGRWFEASQL